MISITGKVTVTKDRVNEIFEAVRKADGASVTIGVHEDAMPYETPGQPPVATVAWRNEFGHNTDGPQVPARPFMMPAIDTDGPATADKLLENIANVTFRNGNLLNALSQAGLRIAIAIRRNILSNTPPELSGSWEPPSGYLGTKRLLGYPQRTLVATYTMFKAIAFKAYDGRGMLLGSGKPSTEAPGESGDA